MKSSLKIGFLAFFSIVTTEKIVKLLNRHSGKPETKKGGEEK
jgi:hypothetical protein